MNERKKVGRNKPCPCGSGRKYKKCCLLRSSGAVPPAFQIINEFEDQTVTINFPDPPVVFFDTNVWRSMTESDVKCLEELRLKGGLRYAYSILNYVELMSHLDRAPF